MMRRRLSPPWFATGAETDNSCEATKLADGLPPRRSRVLAINNPIIASGRPRKMSAMKAPTIMFSTRTPEFAFFPLHFYRRLVEQKITQATDRKARGTPAGPHNSAATPFRVEGVDGPIA